MTRFNAHFNQEKNFVRKHKSKIFAKFRSTVTE